MSGKTPKIRKWTIRLEVNKENEERERECVCVKIKKRVPDEWQALQAKIVSAMKRKVQI